MPAIRYGRPTINQTLTLLGMRGWSGGILVAVKKALTISITPAARSRHQDKIQPASTTPPNTPPGTHSTIVIAAKPLAATSLYSQPTDMLTWNPIAPKPIIRPANLIRPAIITYPLLKLPTLFCSSMARLVLLRGATS
jgi:hypothetical protein